jgi:general transcription factor 3C polypeptide 3 (transcription factor C subunit 4)
MRLEHVKALVDLLLAIEDLEGALNVIRRGQRWLSGRGQAVEWDGFSDDREYDPPGTVRDDGELEQGNDLDVYFRQKLALIRLRLKDDEEAMVRHPRMH